MDVHVVHHLEMNVISPIITSVEDDERRTMLDSGGLCLGEEGNKGDNGGNSELHVDFW